MREFLPNMFLVDDKDLDEFLTKNKSEIKMVIGKYIESYSDCCVSTNNMNEYEFYNLISRTTFFETLNNLITKDGLIIFTEGKSICIALCFLIWKFNISKNRALNYMQIKLPDYTAWHRIIDRYYFHGPLL